MGGEIEELDGIFFFSSSCIAGPPNPRTAVAGGVVGIESRAERGRGTA